MANILIIEDDVAIADTIRACVQNAGHTYQIANCGESGLKLCQQMEPNLIILDLGLPDIDGLKVCENIRQNQTPYNPFILMLTARVEDDDLEIGVSMGADDYLRKPFSPKELKSRIYALLRRDVRLSETALSQKLICSARLRIDQERGEVFVRSSFSNPWKRVTNLSDRQVKLLALMAKHPGRTWEFETLIAHFWRDADGDDKRQAIHSCVSKLRTSLRESGGIGEKHPFIKNVANEGYKFRDEKI
ncbi:response regulator transcription factor [Leptolyngbya sp. NIES-2104]|uniref:response regulator transcription factor n=1 Tax=Leptolyngbya sp. NIES-2104 TaxID=1552121 RepID=UPI0006ECB579|nr:response regulator transcription factor [Leptolyngbya sp. NIES-2104]GAQ00118.1 two-component system response regulator [Leptolyngbya sp. NIES-2104]